MGVRGRGSVGSRLDSTSFDSYPPTKGGSFGPYRPGELVVLDSDSSSEERRKKRKKRKREEKKEKRKQKKEKERAKRRKKDK